MVIFDSLIMSVFAAPSHPSESYLYEGLVIFVNLEVIKFNSDMLVIGSQIYANSFSCKMVA